jgi:hypothetical protein
MSRERVRESEFERNDGRRVRAKQNPAYGSETNF